MVETISGYGGSVSTQFLKLTHGEAAAAVAETRREYPQQNYTTQGKQVDISTLLLIGWNDSFLFKLVDIFGIDVALSFV